MSVASRSLASHSDYAQRDGDSGSDIDSDSGVLRTQLYIYVEERRSTSNVIIQPLSVAVPK